MCSDLNEDFPVEAGVRLALGTQGEYGSISKDGGSYPALENKLSLKEFEDKFYAARGFEERRDDALNSYLQSAGKAG